MGQLEEHRTPHGQGCEHFLAQLVSKSHCVGRRLTGWNTGRSSSPRSLNMASMSWDVSSGSRGQLTATYRDRTVVAAQTRVQCLMRGAPAARASGLVRTSGVNHSDELSRGCASVPQEAHRGHGRKVHVDHVWLEYHRHRSVVCLVPFCTFHSDDVTPHSQQGWQQDQQG